MPAWYLYHLLLTEKNKLSWLDLRHHIQDDCYIKYMLQPTLFIKSLFQMSEKRWWVICIPLNNASALNHTYLFLQESKEERKRRTAAAANRVRKSAALNLRYIQPGPDRDSSPGWIDPLFGQNLHDTDHFITEWAQAEAVYGGCPPHPHPCQWAPFSPPLPAWGRQPWGCHTLQNKQTPIPSL